MYSLNFIHYAVRIQSISGKVELTMFKLSGEKWPSIGSPLPRDKEYVLTKDTGRFGGFVFD